MSGTPILYKLLTQASSLPCSNGAAAFLSMVPSENNWFPLALDALLPALQDQNLHIPQRILAAYILHALYASYDHLNPFHDHLLHIFESERAAAVVHFKSFDLGSPEFGLVSPQESSGGLHAENEQLVWVLWKILKGEGEDLAPYSPNILSRTALPEHLRALHLVLQSAQNHSPDVPFNALYSPNLETSHSHQLTRATEQNGMSRLEPDLSPTVPRPPPAHVFPARAPESTRMSHTNSFSPFEDGLSTDSQQNSGGLRSGQGGMDWWLREVHRSDFHQGHDQLLSPLAFRPFAPHSHMSPPESTFDPTPEAVSPSPTEQRFSALGIHRRQALLRALCEEPMQGGIEDLLHLRDGSSRSRDWVDGEFEGRNGIGGHFGNEPSQIQTGPQTHRAHSQPAQRTRSLQPQFSTSPPEEPGAPRYPFQYGPAPMSSNFTPAAASTNSSTPPATRLGPIARPCPAPSLYYTSVPYSAPSALTIPQQTQPQPVNGLVSRVPMVITRSLSPHSWSYEAEAQPPMTAESGQPTRGQTSSQPARSPGVIGSGRPSSKSVSPVAVVSLNVPGPVEKRSQVGVIGNGRPASSSSASSAGGGHETFLTRNATANASSDVGGEAMMSLSLHGERGGEENARRDFGAIGKPPRNATRDVGEVMRVTKGFHVPVKAPPGEEVHEAASAPPKQARTLVPDRSGHLANLEKVPKLKTSSPDIHFVPTPIRRPLENGAKSDTQELAPLPQSIPSAIASSSVEHFQNKQQSEISHLPPVRFQGQKVSLDSEIDEKERDEVSRAIVLLLSARERVLTLPEQRMLIPHLPMLTRPLSLLRPRDLPQLVAKNPDVAAKLLVLLLDRDDEDSARVEQVLRNMSKSELSHLKFQEGLRPENVPSATSPDSVGAMDDIQTAVEFVNNCGGVSTLDAPISPFGGREAREGYLDALRKLPPTMQSFNLIARLLRPSAVTAVNSAGGQQDTSEVKVAKLVKAEVLGGLISGCVQWVEKTEKEEKEGELLGDRVAVAVSSLCRFYSSLLKHGFVSALSEVDTTEIMSFALQFSRFEEARCLYSTLAAPRA